MSRLSTIQKQQQAIYKVVTIKMQDDDNGKPSIDWLKEQLWGEDSYINIEDYTYATGIGIWRDVKNQYVYITCPTTQVELNKDSINDDDKKYFIVDYTGKTSEAELIVYDLNTRQAVLRVADRSGTMGVITVPKKEVVSVGVDVYIIAWRLNVDAAAIMKGTVSDTNFTLNGIHDDIFINSPDFMDRTYDGGVQTKYGGAVFNEKTGTFVGMMHWTRLGNSYGVMPARQIYKSILSLQYEILPNFVPRRSDEDDLVYEKSATNDYFTGMHGRRFDPVRNILINFDSTDPRVSKKGNVGMFVTRVLYNGPASNVGIKDIGDDEGTLIWAIKEHECDQWTYINEHNSFDSILEKWEMATKKPSWFKQPKMLPTVSPTAISLTCNHTKKVYLLISTKDNTSRLTETEITLERARHFFDNYVDGDNGSLESFLDNSDQNVLDGRFAGSEQGYAEQDQNP